MYCQSCGSVLSQDARFCQSCGKQQVPPVPVVTPKSPAAQVLVSPQQRKRSSSKILWSVVGGTVLLVAIVGIIGKSPTDNSTSANQQSSASNATPQPHIATPSVPPPKFRIYKLKTDEPTSVVVPVNTTDEQLKSLLWFFREKVRARQFKDIGLTKATAK
jgi:hypothetical protein